MQPSRIKAYIFVSIAVIFWGLSFIWTNALLQFDIPIFIFIFLRLILAGVYLFVFCAVLHKVQKIKKEDIKWFILLACFEPFLYFIGETFGMKATNSPTLSALFIATIPIFTMCGDRIFYKAQLTKQTIIGVLMTLPGVAIMVYNGGAISVGSWWGIPLLVLAVISAGGYNLVVRRLVDSYAPSTLCYMQFLIGSVMFFPFMLKASQSFDFHILTQPRVFLPIICLAIFCSCVAFTMQIKAIRVIGITKASVFNATIPIVSAIVAFAIGMETFTIHQIIGIVVVVFAVILAQSKPIHLHKNKA